MPYFLHNTLQTLLEVHAEVDLVIVDTGVNDAVVENFGSDVNNVKLAHEVFIRHIRTRMFHMPALLYSETFIAPDRARHAPRQAENLAAIHADVTQKYGIPMASFRDAVWPDTKDSALAESIWGREIHPNWKTHQLIADVIVYYISKSYGIFLDEHGLLSDPSLLEESVVSYEKQMGCMGYERLFRLDAENFEQVLVQSEGWSFSPSNETHGEIIFIGFGNTPNQEAVATFDLPCTGQRPVLDIGYLLSYEGMGAVEVTVAGTDTIVVVDGLWGSLASVGGYKAISIPEGSRSTRVTFEILTVESEAPYSRSLYNGTAHTPVDVRGRRQFKITSMQC